MIIIILKFLFEVSENWANWTYYLLGFVSLSTSWHHQLVFSVMSKRALEKSGSRYLYFISAGEAGLCVTAKCVDVSTVADPTALEAMFDDVLVVNRKRPRSQHEPAELLMTYVEKYITRALTPKEWKIAKKKQESLQTKLASHNIMLPSKWSREDWGKWKNLSDCDLLMTEGKHYYYDLNA